MRPREFWTKKAKNPFRFYTSLKLRELTGEKARNLRELAEIIKTVPGSVIYYHTHVYLQRHEGVLPAPPNDFAYWVTNVLGEHKLGEELSSIDTCSFFTIRELREKIISVIESHLFETKEAFKVAPAGREFDFLKAHSFVVPTEYAAHNLKEFTAILEKITIHSVYFHIFEARLRVEKGVNDFSFWIDTSIGATVLANIIATLDPYTFTMEGLREKLINIVKDWCRVNQ